MRKLFIGLGLVVILLIGAVVALPALVPSSLYKQKITDQVSSALGRDVTINGDVKLSVLPVLKARANNVVIANPDGFSDRPFAKMDSLEARVKLFPLFKKQVVITSFNLVRPVISLEKTKTGQMNWVFGEQKPTEVKPESGPFRRDGRFTETDISLGKFALKDGQVLFNDAQGGKQYNLENVNMKLAMPGLDKTATAEGSLVINDQPLELAFSLNTPKAFLSGEAAPVMVKVKSDLGNLEAKGRFTPSQLVTFDLNVKADIPSTSRLDAFLGIKNPYGALTETASLTGNLAFDGANISGKNTDVRLESNLLKSHFKGDFSAGQAKAAAGTLSVNVQDLGAVQNTLGMKIPQLAAFKTLTLASEMETDGKATNAKNLIIDIKGDGISANYHGAARFDKALSLDGSFKADSPSVAALLPKLGMKNIKGADLVGNLAVSGKVKGVVDRLKLSGIDFKTTGGELVASYQGDVQLGPDMAINGAFEASGASVPAIVNKLGMTDLKAAAALGDFSVKGQLSGSPAALNISALDFKTNGDNLTASYQGNVTTGKTVSLDGQFNLSSPSVKTLAQTAGLTLPYVDALGRLQAGGHIGGTKDALAIDGIKAALSDGLLNVNFDGQLKTGKALGYEGEVALDIPSLRKLAALGGTELPPDTEKGQVFGPFSLTGHAKGSAKRVSFTDAKLKMDQLEGTGKFAARLIGKPYLTSRLDMKGLDIRPYQAAVYANRPAGIQPWSKEKMNFDFLKAFDGNFTLSTPFIKTLTVEMGPSTIKTSVKNGVLNTKIPNFTMYGGTGLMDFTLNAAGSVPQIAMDFTLQNVDGKSFLGAAANFTRLSGNTGTTFSFRGRGNSQYEIMKSLSGKGNFEIAKGVVEGVDLGKFVQNLNSLDSVLKTRAMPAGLGAGYSTPFNKIRGLVTIENGVARIGNFSLKTKTALAEGNGRIDLANQSVDFNLRPRLLNGKGLAAYGIPLKFSGGFGNIHAGLDTDFMGQIVKAKAKAALQDQITNKVGGQAGSILGGLMGGQTQPAPAANDTSGANGASGQNPSSPRQEKKPSTEDVVGGILGGLIGGDSGKKQAPPPQNNEAQNDNTQKPAPKKEAPKKKEDPLEKALGGLFGGGG